MKRILTTAFLVIILAVSVLLPTSILAATEPGEAINIQNLDVIAPDDLTAEDFPGQEDTMLPSDIFGVRSGYFHPFMSLTVKYSDNIFRDREDTVSDWSMVFSPGIWIAVPASDQVILSVSSSTAQPGGLSMFLETPEAFSRYQTYVFYGADIEKFLDFDERDHTKQTANGFFQYNFRGGLSLNMYDKWIDSQDPLRFRDTIIFDEYISNLAGFLADYDVTEKLKLRLDLNNYYLKYDDTINLFKDRRDNALSLYTFYTYSPKTSLFAEYRYIDVDHDQETSPDSVENSFYGGTIWDPTEATSITAKLGASQKDFSSENSDTVTDLSFELHLGHAFTQKTSITLFATQKLNETKIPGTTYQLMRAFSGTYNHRFTEKISGTLTAGLINNDYKSNGGTGSDRDDIVYDLEPGIQFMVKRWLMVRAWYAYTKRDSSDDVFDYEENTFYMGVSGGM